MHLLRRLLIVLAAVSVAAACASGTSDSTSDSSAANTSAADRTPNTGQGVRVVSATAGGDILADPPDGLVVLDVRTPEEFVAGHLPDAILVDYNAPGFAEAVGELDPNAPYLLYCRSGNRSSGARAVMEDLGFVDVADVDGGILAWADAGLPVTTG